MTKHKYVKDPEGHAASDRLLSAALDLFTEKGYAATSVREIVEAAGVSKPVLYYYFKNKEGIYLRLLQGPFVFLEKILDDALTEGGSPVTCLFNLYGRIFRLFAERLKEARLMYSIYYGPPQGAPFIDFEAYHLKMREVTGHLVAEGIKSGEFKPVDADAATWLLIGALNFVMEEQLCHCSPQVGEEGLSRILGLVFEGLINKKEKKKR